jgi:hypothetical protein
LKEPNFKSVSELTPEQADLRRQQAVAKSIDSAIPEWLKGGRLVSGKLTDAEELQLTHGLGRVPKGWFLGSTAGDADMQNVVQTAANKNTLDLQNQGASGELRFVMWVY